MFYPRSRSDGAQGSGGDIRLQWYSVTVTLFPCPEGVTVSGEVCNSLWQKSNTVFYPLFFYLDTKRVTHLVKVVTISDFYSIIFLNLTLDEDFASMIPFPDWSAVHFRPGQAEARVRQLWPGGRRLGPRLRQSHASRQVKRKEGVQYLTILQFAPISKN